MTDALHTRSKKIALITGASSGIGEAVAVALAKDGCQLILCGRRKHKLEALQHTLAAYTSVQLLTFDVRDKHKVDEQINSLPADWKHIDVLVNSAGNAHGMSFIHEDNVDDWDAMIDGNVKGLLYVSKAVIPQMVERSRGHIINISSVAGKQTYPKGAVYCASKKAVEAISEGMRLDLTPHKIKVTNIAPGAVATEFSQVRFKGDKEKAAQVYKGYEPLLAEDVADMIRYLVNAPERVTIADVTMYSKAQASASLTCKEEEK